MIKLEQLRVFLAVAEKQSLTDAADLINRTPAAISMTLKQLEANLGAPLFEGERKTQLTKLGAFVMLKAQKVIDEFDSSLKDILRYSRGEEGVIRIAVVPSIARNLLPQIIDDLQKKAPKLSIEIRDTDSESVAIAVSSNIVDFGIAGKSVNSNNLLKTLLIDETFDIICRYDHPLTKLNRPIQWHDLKSFPFISNGLCRRMDIAEVNDLVKKSTLFLHNVTTLYAFIEQGYGITLLPRLTVDKSEKLVSLPLKVSTIKRSLYLFKRNSEKLSPAASYLENEIKKSIKNNAAFNKFEDIKP